MKKFVAEFRQSKGQFPTLKDLANAGFSKKEVEKAVKEEWLTELYINLTTGTVVKGYKIKI